MTQPERPETPTRVENTKLFDRVYACLLGGAIGDALGGPVEGWAPERIRIESGGNLDRYLPYRKPPGYHAQFGEGDRIAAYTDDTRMKHLICEAILEARGIPRAGDYRHVLARAYHTAPDRLHKGFLEEYYFKAVWGTDKAVFGGEPTNGAIMSNSPIGLIAACRPDLAYACGFELAFVTVGYAKTAAAMMAAAVASAMRPRPTVDSVIDEMCDTHLAFAKRREGPLWFAMASTTFEPEDLRTNWRYDPNLRFLTSALKIARDVGDVFAIREPLYSALEWTHLFSEATHTLVVPIAMFVAANGDFRDTVVGSVMYGRDNDSYASVGGALAGAFGGTAAIPQEWIQPVIEANPEVDIHSLAVELTTLILEENSRMRRDSIDLTELAQE